MKKLNYIKLFEAFNRGAGFEMPDLFELTPNATNKALYLLTSGNEEDHFTFLVDYDNLKKLYSVYNLFIIKESIEAYATYKKEGNYEDISVDMEIVDRCPANSPILNVIIEGIPPNYFFYAGDLDSSGLPVLTFDGDLEIIDSNFNHEDLVSLMYDLEDRKALIKFDKINSCFIEANSSNVWAIDELNNGKVIMDSDTALKYIGGYLDDENNLYVNSSKLPEEEKHSIMETLIDYNMDMDIINKIKNILFNKG